MKVTTIGLDLAKNVFQVHGAPEFDTKRDKLLIHIGRASNLPLQEGQLGVLGRFSYVQSLQHLCLRVVNR